MTDGRDKNLEKRRKKAIFRSWHRGCKETDLVLGRFCDRHINGFGEAEIYQFEAVLEEEDSDLYKWLTGAQPVPDRLKQNPIFALLLEFDVANA